MYTFWEGPLDPTTYLETNEDQERADKNQQKRLYSLMNQNHSQVSGGTAVFVSSRKYLLGVTVSCRGKEIENRYLKTLKRVESSSRSRGNKFKDE
jgi:hypothetical protein